MTPADYHFLNYINLTFFHSIQHLSLLSHYLKQKIDKNFAALMSKEILPPLYTQEYLTQYQVKFQKSCVKWHMDDHYNDDLHE